MLIKRLLKIKKKKIKYKFKSPKNKTTRKVAAKTKCLTQPLRGLTLGLRTAQVIETLKTTPPSRFQKLLLKEVVGGLGLNLSQ